MPTSNIHPAVVKPTIRPSGSVPTLQQSTRVHEITKGRFGSITPSTHFHDFQKQLNESILKSSQDALANDLEKSKYQIKEFEGRVSRKVWLYDTIYMCVLIR